MIKKIAINIILLILVLVIMELACALFEITKRLFEPFVVPDVKIPFKERVIDYFYWLKDSYTMKREFNPAKRNIRYPVVMNSSKRPILISGCSYAYGFLIPEKECLHYILAHKTNRTVSNIGITGGCPIETLYYFRHKDLLAKQMNNNFDIEYHIYVFFEGQKNRLFIDNSSCVQQYKIDKKTKEITFLPDKFIYHLFMYLEYKQLKEMFIPKEEQDEVYNLFMRAIYKEQKKIFPNSKMVIFSYTKEDDNALKGLEKEEIQIINLGEETTIDWKSGRYQAIDRSHPNGLLWEEAAKILQRKLNL